MQGEWPANSGAWGFFSPNGGGTLTYHDMGLTNPAYQLAGKADFTGDGIADLALRNPTTGDVGIFAQDGQGGEGWHDLDIHDGRVRLSLQHVLYVRTNQEEHRVGFG